MAKFDPHARNLASCGNVDSFVATSLGESESSNVRHGAGRSDATFSYLCLVLDFEGIFEREREKATHTQRTTQERQEQILKDSTRLDEDYRLRVHQNQKVRILQDLGDMKNRSKLSSSDQKRRYRV